ncbi:hypothetical protein I203_101340 [Kwoniella mangroviensis CBS 8507]|uniref:uncharacterized protein n=1 Tax=Kwoniella mangroviensis CBS 8507 TaxID=1296122 RepID=UPI00080D1044|nr:histone deacetylase 6/10 [Kwoniella mangroviensis CBS 8507]OCF68311.1 histone deacetylase 6/10 [Kwoniella mangroviensis CBS 8507]
MSDPNLMEVDSSTSVRGGEGEAAASGVNIITNEKPQSQDQAMEIDSLSQPDAAGPSSEAAGAVFVEQTTTTTSIETTISTEGDSGHSLPLPLPQTIASAALINDELSIPTAGPSHTHLPPTTGAPYDLFPQSTSNLQIIERPKIYRTGYIYNPMMMLHCQEGYIPTAESVVDNGPGHPEEPMRIKRIFSRLAEQGLIKRMKRLEFGEVTMDQVMLVHGEDLWLKVQGTEDLTDEYIQGSKQYYEQLSLYVCRETAHCARLSCGGVIQACISVCQKQVRNAFAIVRPPGHHAEPDEHMGFCFFNNVAVATKEVQRRGLAKKVLILDWDVHHGNGTQRAFWDDPDVLYISLHRHDGGRFYPTSDFGALDMVGTGAGEGKSVNIPWPGPGFGDADYIYAFQRIVMPIAYEFAPDLVIISAGFDAADGDRLGECHVTPAAYGHMTHMLSALAGGKLVVALEGGYNLKAISDSALAVAQVLLGETPAELDAHQASEVATEVIYQCAKVQSKYWKSIDVKACEPPEVTALEDGSLPITSIPDLLKLHRAWHMYEKHQLFQIPLASEELEASFGGQVLCSENVYEMGPRGVLVIFVHDFGNLRVETDGVSTTNVHMANSYLINTSDAIVDWVKKEGYNLIDVNVLKQLPTHFAPDLPKMVSKSGTPLEAQLIRYIWDNYIELSEAENIVLIGHGTGCKTIMDLVNQREVEQKVKAVIQVAGLHSLVRPDPNDEVKRSWFRKSNRIYVPAEHPVLEDERIQKRLGGQVHKSDKATKVVDVLVEVLPNIKEFVSSKLPEIERPAPLLNGNGNVDGNADGSGDEQVRMEVDVEVQDHVNGHDGHDGSQNVNGSGDVNGGEPSSVIPPVTAQ